MFVFVHCRYCESVEGLFTVQTVNGEEIYQRVHLASIAIAEMSDRINQREQHNYQPQYVPVRNTFSFGWSTGGPKRGKRGEINNIGWLFTEKCIEPLFCHLCIFSRLIHCCHGDWFSMFVNLIKMWQTGFIKGIRTWFKKIYPEILVRSPFRGIN